MKRLLWMLMLVTAVPALRAQNPADSSDDAERQQLQRELRQRWNARVRQDLNLTDDQAVKLQATEDRHLAQRRDLAQQQRGVQEALRQQLQPGIAANGDSVRRLMDTREKNRATLAQIDRDEDRELAGYLTPVQHARYQMLRQQLQERIRQIREQRRLRGQAGPRAGIPGPRPRPGGRPRRRP